MTVEIFFANAGVALAGCMLWCDQRWVDRHFLPSIFASHRTFVIATAIGRSVLAVFGLVLALVVRPRMGRHFCGCAGSRVLLADVARMSLAVVRRSGRVKSFFAARSIGQRRSGSPSEVPNRQPDPHLGWRFVPAHVGHDTIGGRNIEYAFDPASHRVRGANEKVDPERPTVVFTGESIIVGQGLTWEESIPGQVEMLLGIQTANIAVHGFANDQAYMRLRTELPRFRQPVAVVSLFTPQLFDRNLMTTGRTSDPDLSGFHRNRWLLFTALFKWLIPTAVTM